MKHIILFIENVLIRHIDKVAHFVLSYTITLTFVCASYFIFDAPIDWGVNFAIAVGILFGISKEFYDLYIKKSKFSIADIVADVLGIGLAFLIVGV